MIYNVNKPLSLVWQTWDKDLFTYIIRSGQKVTTHTQPFNNSRNSSQNFAKTSENIDMGYVYIKSCLLCSCTTHGVVSHITVISNLMLMSCQNPRICKFISQLTRHIMPTVGDIPVCFLSSTNRNQWYKRGVELW